MTHTERLDALAKLGTTLAKLDSEERNAVFEKATLRNPWFTHENLERALAGVCRYLERDALNQWAAQYPLDKTPQKKVGVVMAGNIPMVGFHDMLCVLVAGHILHGKLSQKDEVLLPFVAEKLSEIEPRFAERIHWTERLKEVDAYIATGSNNSARYFEHYFADYPHLIRKNRTAWAVLSGEETDEELLRLGEDVFTYFGLGCRNVSRLWLPEGYDMKHLLDVWQAFEHLCNHNKYLNNYEYQRGIRLMNQRPIYDSGFLVLEESEGVTAPTGMLFYGYYKQPDEIHQAIEAADEDIQCVVSKTGDFRRGVRFGEAQKPKLSDYADGVDTMDFLTRKL